MGLFLKREIRVTNLRCPTTIFKHDSILPGRYQFPIAKNHKFPDKEHPMRKLVVVFIALLFAIATYSSVLAAAPDHAPLSSESQASLPSTVNSSAAKKVERNKWKSSERYEFLHIDGIHETYSAGEAINLYVQGKSNMLEVTEENGFYVAATFFALPKIKGERVPVVYDVSKRTWRVIYTVPTDTSTQYEIVVHLFCGKTDIQNESSCEAMHGERTQIDKFIPIQVH